MTILFSRTARRRKRSIPAFAALAIVGALATGCVRDMTDSTIFGTATYRERILLRPGSVLEVSVVETSRADAPGEVVASQRLEDIGAPPYHFVIPIRPNKIDERLTYVARATISSGDTMILTTDTAYPVLTRGAGNEVDLVLRGTGAPESASITDLPATFVGILPCADCEGIQYHLDLLPDSGFYLQRTYLGLTDGIVDQVGSWTADPASGTLAIWGEDEMPTRFRVTDNRTLRLLDQDGRDIESELNYDLLRQPTFDPATLTLPLRGVYQYQADAASFVECESGRRFNVAMENDHAALESAYLEARREPGQSLLVSFNGRVTMRPPMEGSGTVPTVVVDEFTGVWPTETCGARMTMSELRDTNWVLTRLGNEPIVLDDNMREPRFMLSSADNRISGFGGCNNFTGEYSVTGTSMRLGPLATTLRACAAGGDLEARFLAALEATRSYRRYRNHLELYDEERNTVARLESRALD
jgi:copper homeostasis protein (lipoprotein)